VLISNYGLYWRRENIAWGRSNVKGHLKGHLATARTSKPLDFRDQQGIYVLYDDNFSIVYVGQAGSKNQRLFSRLKQHRKDHLADRWSRFSWFGVRKILMSGELSAENKQAHPKLSEVLNHIEAILIAAAEPPLNRQSGKFGENVEHYLQYIDASGAHGSAEEMIRKIYIEKFGK